VFLMWKKIGFWGLGLLVVCLTLFGWSGTKVAKADDITSSMVGLDKPSKIEEKTGLTTWTVVPVNEELESGQYYRLTYLWKPVNGTHISDGDTAKITWPATSSPGTVEPKDIIESSSKNSIGTYAIPSSDSSIPGEIKFNGVLSNATMFNTGTIRAFATGTATTGSGDGGTGTGGGSSIISKNGWVSQKDGDIPTQAVWNIAFNPNSKNLGKVTLTDNLGAYQTYIPNSVDASAGGQAATDSSPAVVEKKLTESKDYNIEASGSKITMTFYNVTRNVSLTYLVNVDSNKFVGQSSGVLSNHVDLITQSGDTGGVGTGSGEGTDKPVLDSGSIGKDILWGTPSGDGNPDATLDGIYGEVKLTKMAKDGPDKLLMGAEYTLKRLNAVTGLYDDYQTFLTTNVSGQIDDSGLDEGSYKFIETKAPKGYSVNTKPIAFEITPDNPSASVSQEDESSVPTPGTDTGSGSSSSFSSSSGSSSTSSSSSSSSSSSTSTSSSTRTSTSTSSSNSADSSSRHGDRVGSTPVPRASSSTHGGGVGTVTGNQASSAKRHGQANGLLPKTNEAKSIFAALGGLLLIGGGLSVWQYRRTRQK